MATRKKDWSLTDRLLEGSDGSGDRLNPSRRSAVGSRLSPTYRQEAQRNRMFGGGGARNPAAQASQKMDPANTRKVVSKIVNQFNQRDSVDRQGRFPSPMPRTGMPSTHTQYREGHLAGIRSTYPEGYAQTRKAERGSPVGTDVGTASIRRSKALMAESTWAVPDLGPGRGRVEPGASSYSPTKSSAQGGILPARLGSGMGMPRDDRSGTQAAYRAADTSMFNSTVTPKAAPLKDYKPRGKTVKDKNIQAFY